MVKTEQMPAEVRVLLICARAHVDERLVRELCELLAQSVDWAELLRLAQRHRVGSLLYHNLHAHAAERTPPDVLRQLQASFLANQGHNRFRTGELVRLLEHLSAHSIPAVPLKGPALAARLYGNLALRHFGDLDILVRQNDALRAKQLLLDEGYQLASQIGAAHEDAYLRFQHHYQLVSARRGIVLELHYRIRENYFAVSFDNEAIWRRLQTMSLGGRAIGVLSTAETLLTLCVHGASHCWHRLFWICDIAELLRTHPDIDWPELIVQAGQLGCTRMLGLSLLLARDLLDAPLPEQISRWANADLAAGQLAAQVAAGLGDTVMHLPPLRDTIPFHIKARERWRDRMQYCIRLALTPTEGDWSLIALPNRLSFVYYLLRPFRLLWAYRSARLRRFPSVSSQ